MDWVGLYFYIYLTFTFSEADRRTKYFQTHISHNSPMYGYLQLTFQAEIHQNKDHVSIPGCCYCEHSVKLTQFVLRIERTHVYIAWAKRSVPYCYSTWYIQS